MLIAGVVIDVLPERAIEAARALEKYAGVTRVEGPVKPGRLVAVVEAEDNEAMDNLVASMLKTTGIVNVNPAYIHFDA